MKVLIDRFPFRKRAEVNDTKSHHLYISDEHERINAIEHSHNYLFLEDRPMKKDPLRVVCTYCGEGRDVKELIEESFIVYMMSELAGIAEA
jgi:hypothetical protein